MPGLILAIAAVFAIANWIAVWRGNKTLEYVAKPATMVALIAFAATIDADDVSRQRWFLLALVLSLAGDVFLMLPRSNLFLAGLVSFLVAHIAYIAGFGLDDLWPAVIGVAILSLIVGTPVVRTVDRDLLVPVVVYMVVITVMLTVAATSGIAAAAVGAAMFYVSDALIAYNRFVFDEPRRSIGVAIMVLYHLGQAGLVLSLLD